VEQDASVGTTKDVFEELLSHQLLLQLYGNISEVSLLIAGRSPVQWWPPDRLATLPSVGSAGSLPQAGSGAPSGQGSAAASRRPTADEPAPAAPSASGALATATRLAATAVQAMHGAQHGTTPSTSSSSSSSAKGLLVGLEEEVDLVAIKFQGAQVAVTASGEGFTTEVAMAALTMDDLLVGAKNPGKAHMARSQLGGEQQGQQQGQRQAAAGVAAATAAHAAAAAAAGEQAHAAAPPGVSGCAAAGLACLPRS
jgi:hypothetical protein